MVLVPSPTVRKDNPTTMVRTRTLCILGILALCLALSGASLAERPGPATISDLRLIAAPQPAEGSSVAPQRALQLSLPPAFAQCTRIAYQSWVGGNWEIMTMAADGNGKTRITDNDDQDESPSLGAGCALIAFSSNRDGDDEIYVMQADGSQVQQLTTHSADDVLPALSPDGSQIAFQSYRNGTEPEIYVMPTSGGTPTRLTWNGAYDGQPTWSPDGTQIAFISDRSGSKNIWIMSASGTGAWQVTAFPHAGGPNWSPDGQWIALASDDIGTGFTALWRVRADGSQAEMIYRPDASDTDAWPSAWSPDSQYILFEQAVWEYDDGWDMTSSRLDLIDVADTSQRSTLAGGGIHMDASWALCDVAAPVSWMTPLPENSGSPLALSWGGSDDCATPLEYQLQYRIGSAGTWTEWQVTPGSSWTTATEGTLTLNAAAITLYFRVRARDALGNEEAWRSTPDTSTTIPAQVMGQIVDARGLGVAGAVVRSLKPLGFSTETGSDGSYLLQTAGEQTIWLRASAEGYAAADLWVPLSESAATADIVLLPQTELLDNPSFENDLAGWNWQRGTEVVASNYGYGNQLVRMGYAPAPLASYPQTTALSQRLTIPAKSNSPTLSFVYAIVAEAEHTAGLLTVDLVDGKTTRLFTSEGATAFRTLDDGSTVPIWQRVDADLSAWQGRTIELLITFDHQWGAGYALLDRLSIGPWMTPLVSGISPERLQPQAPGLLAIRGANFDANGPITATINGQQLQVLDVTSDQILARTGPLAPGTYSLCVQNPGGAGRTLADSLLIQNHIVVPLILR